jgi:hypothetical protein
MRATGEGAVMHALDIEQRRCLDRQTLRSVD